MEFNGAGEKILFFAFSKMTQNYFDRQKTRSGVVAFGTSLIITYKLRNRPFPFSEKQKESPFPEVRDHEL